MLKTGLLAAAAGVSIMAAFAHFKRPYPFVFGVASAAFIVQAFAVSKRPISRNVTLAIGSSLLALAVAEVTVNRLEEWTQGSYTYLFDPPGARETGGWDPHWQVDDLVGYRPVPDATVRATKRFRGTLVYDARYGFDENGWRRIPGSNPAASESILFFGGSYAFGEALNDDQTIPHDVAVLLEGRYSVYSFAFGGYGAHEMLSILENGLENGWMREGQIPRFAIYIAIPQHVARVAGHTAWNRFGPRYVLEGGAVRRAGSFSDQDLVPRWANRFLMPSGLMRRFYYQRFQTRPVTAEDRILFARIVEQASRIFETRHPGAEFHVAFFGPPGTRWPRLDLPATRIHHLWKSLPRGLWSREPSRDRYFIPLDGHPTARTNRLVASSLVDTILAEKPRSQGGSDPGRPARESSSRRHGDVLGLHAEHARRRRAG